MKLATAWRPLALAVALTCACAATASAAVNSLSLDPTAQLSPGQLHATVTGSITCDYGDNLSITGQVVQSKASGYGYTPVSSCDGTSQPFSIDVSASGGIFGVPGGAFKPGKASAQVSTSICDPFTWICTSKYADDTIRLVK
jgi:hypothetical protein